MTIKMIILRNMYMDASDILDIYISFIYIQYIQQNINILFYAYK